MNKNWWETTLCEIEKILERRITSSLSLKSVSIKKIDEICDIISYSNKKYKHISNNFNSKPAYLEMFNTRDMTAWLHYKFRGEDEDKNIYTPLSKIQRDLKKYLFFYDKVIIKEPIGDVLALSKTWPYNWELTELAKTRRIGNIVLQEGLRFWASLRTLLRKGLIETYPSNHMEKLYSNNRVESLCLLDNDFISSFNEVKDGIFQTYTEYKKYGGILDIANGIDNPNMKHFNTSLVFCKNEGYELVPQSLFGAFLLIYKSKVLESLLEKKNTSIRYDLSISACKLPLMKDLNNKDLIQLHKDNLSFKSWRVRYDDIVKEIDLGSSESFSKIVNKRIPEISNELEKSLEQYGFGNKLKKAGMSFSAGAISAYTLSPESLSIILGGAITSSMNLLFSVLFERAHKSDLVLKRFYKMIIESKSDKIPII